MSKSISFEVFSSFLISLTDVKLKCF
uniref:Uncharacterized protein n=1 Tax=Arundo donax TaxID=35708 RepID=A0A0A9BGT0_ARUDO